jgi:hypothetical protein
MSRAVRRVPGCTRELIELHFRTVFPFNQLCNRAGMFIAASPPRILSCARTLLSIGLEGRRSLKAGVMVSNFLAPSLQWQR